MVDIHLIKVQLEKWPVTFYISILMKPYLSKYYIPMLHKYAWPILSGLTFQLLLTKQARKEVLAFQVSNSPNSKLIMDTLDELTENIPEGIKPIIHSDQGWHYQLNYYTDKLSEKNLYKACLVRETVLIMRQLKASFIFLKQNVLMDFHSVKILENSRKSQRITSIGLTIDEYHRKQKA